MSLHPWFFQNCPQHFIPQALKSKKLSPMSSQMSVKHVTISSVPKHSRSTMQIIHGVEVVYTIGDCVMLSTFHWWREYQKKGDTNDPPNFSLHGMDLTQWSMQTQNTNNMLNMDGHNNIFPTFHPSKLKLHVTNDKMLFPNWDHPQPGLVLTSDGLEEHEIESIIDSRCKGHRWQFLIRWVSFGPKDNEWLNAWMLGDCEALDWWYKQGGNGPSKSTH